MPDLLEQCIAEMMHEELAGNRLEVMLIPSPLEYWPTERKRRIVAERNPHWYRMFCSEYVSGRRKRRKKKHGDTLIKRQHTLRALNEIAQGDLRTEYARRVYPLVQERARVITRQHGFWRRYENEGGYRAGHVGPAHYGGTAEAGGHGEGGGL